MTYKPIIIVAGEPNSIFFEIYFKAIRYKKFRSPIILIASFEILKLQMKRLNIKKKIRLIDFFKLDEYKFDYRYINLINVNYKQSKPFEKISHKSNDYIKESFNLALKILKKNFSNKFINGPISKKFFLNKKFLGITEYLANKSKSKKFAMLIYNNELSVCPLTTHLPLKEVSKKISKKMLIEKITLIDSFYKNYLKITPKIGVVGLNPHCESIHPFDEDEKIIKPAIKYLSKSKYKVFGPYAADTIFLKKNRKKYDVIVGMYHDQVLTPIKTLFEYDAINITLGLPYLRVSPDHGPNETMLGKNLSNPQSLIKALTFLDQQK
ncbi:4-hydroxythreonine-4-phosphate dehydrogenase PdxA [Candidatus Pelagibacter sp. HIMB1483]|uniref:4-hydroxythreonine-4-phosphate dehydrogenase PdxA n=1 Tax=Candidatus Pelagibacter sp. HIMB1483 TaxID=3415414 RepID=UPI003F8354A5